MITHSYIKLRQAILVLCVRPIHCWLWSFHYITLRCNEYHRTYSVEIAMQVSKLREIDGKALQFVGIRLEKNMSQPRGTGRHLNINILNDHSHPRKRSQRTQQCSCSCPYGLFISSSHRMKDVSQLCLYLLFDITQMTPECLRYVLLQFV